MHVTLKLVYPYYTCISMQERKPNSCNLQKANHGHRSHRIISHNSSMAHHLSTRNSSRTIHRRVKRQRRGGEDCSLCSSVFSCFCVSSLPSLLQPLQSQQVPQRQARMLL